VRRAVFSFPRLYAALRDSPFPVSRFRGVTFATSSDGLEWASNIYPETRDARRER